MGISPKTLSVIEAAERIGVSARTINYWIKNGTKLGPRFFSDPSFKKGWRYIVLTKDVGAYIRRNAK